MANYSAARCPAWAGFRCVSCANCPKAANHCVRRSHQWRPSVCAKVYAAGRAHVASAMANWQLSQFVGPTCWRETLPLNDPGSLPAITPSHHPRIQQRLRPADCLVQKTQPTASFLPPLKAPAKPRASSVQQVASPVRISPFSPLLSSRTA